MSMALALRSSTLFERFVQVHASGAKRGDEAEDHADCERYENSERHDPRIRPDFIHAWQRPIAQSKKTLHGELREKDAKSTANRGQRQTLRKKQASDGCAIRPQCRSYREFTIPSSDVRQKKIGYVRTRDQKQNADGAEKDRKSDADTLRDLLL